MFSGREGCAHLRLVSCTLWNDIKAFRLFEDVFSGNFGLTLCMKPLGAPQACTWGSISSCKAALWLHVLTWHVWILKLHQMCVKSPAVYTLILSLLCVRAVALHSFILQADSLRLIHLQPLPQEPGGSSDPCVVEEVAEAHPRGQSHARNHHICMCTHNRSVSGHSYNSRAMPARIP